MRLEEGEEEDWDIHWLQQWWRYFYISNQSLIILPCRNLALCLSTLDEWDFDKYLILKYHNSWILNFIVLDIINKWDRIHKETNALVIESRDRCLGIESRTWIHVWDNYNSSQHSQVPRIKLRTATAVPTHLFVHSIALCCFSSGFPFLFLQNFQHHMNFVIVFSLNPAREKFYPRWIFVFKDAFVGLL